MASMPMYTHPVFSQKHPRAKPTCMKPKNNSIFSQYVNPPHMILRFTSRLMSIVGAMLLFPGLGVAADPVALGKDSHAQQAAKNVGIWIEGETASNTNFYPGKASRVFPNGPSGSVFLRLQTEMSDQNHPKPPYFASYRFDVSVAGTYHFWFAGSPQNTDWASPVTWKIDHGQPVSLRDKAQTGPTYGCPTDGWAHWIFGWTEAGVIELAAGKHEIEIGVAEPRADGKECFALIDAMLLTTEASYVPAGNHPSYSTQPTWEEQMKTTTENKLSEQLDLQIYRETIGETTEEVNDANAAMVLKKIASRPLPTSNDRARNTTEFGLHGMEQPHIIVGKNDKSPEVARAYELLARTGVDSFRTGDSFWHRVSGMDTPDTKEPHLNFSNLDFQTANACKYGMTHLFTVGLPPASLTMGSSICSACRPEFYPLYRKYLEAMFARYKDKGLDYVEMGNEVDAPDVWWRGATPAHYVQEMKLVYEAMRKIAPGAKSVAFAATYSRDEESGGPEGGRRFVAKCFDLGIDKYSDAYSLHHLAKLAAKDFPAFFRRELARTGNPASVGKKLFDTEQWGDGPYPYDGIKAFARTFFLYDMPRVDFFLARDFFENGYLKPWGLFDVDWRPKLRLLAYAFSVDSMRGRELVGIATPAPGIEAYVLKRIDTYEGKPATPGTATKYAIVLWKTDREMLKLSDKAIIKPVQVGQGLRGVNAAFNWKIDPIVFSKSAPTFDIGDEPIAIYADELPGWRLLTRAQYLDKVEAGKTNAPLPTSNL